MADAAHPVGRPRTRWGPLAASALLAGVFPLAWLIRPLAMEGRYTICIFRTVLDRPCPLCGMTRAFASAAHGQLAQASHYHPLWPLAAGIIAAFAILLAIDGATGSRWAGWAGRRLRPLWLLASAATLAYGLWRWL